MTPKIDWHRAPLSSKTRIDEGYKSTQNVRRYFVAQLGDRFHFTRDFMEWIRGNCGKTLGDAVAEWKRRQEERE